MFSKERRFQKSKTIIHNSKRWFIDLIVKMLSMSTAIGSPVEVDELAGAMWREFVDNGVECELCNEPYDDDDTHEGHVPRLLTCGHTYCQVLL